MGRFICINLSVSKAEVPQEVFRALLSHPDFRPVALGGVDGHEAGDHWFLSGYALEDFVNRFGRRTPAKPASIQIASGSDKANHDYLAGLAYAIQGGRECPTVSPFEEQRATLPATFLPKQEITDLEVTQARQWYRQRSAAVLYLYGTFNLSVRQQMLTAPWDRAFREVSSTTRSPDAPFVFFRFSASPHETGRMNVTTYTESAVWFGNEEEWSEFVAPRNAQTNLSRLTTVVATIKHSMQGAVVEGSLTGEGLFFSKHEAVLRAAFADITRQ